MAFVLKAFYNNYNHVFNELKDPRSSHLPFANSPIPLVLLCVGYTFFVLRLGPLVMKSRKPFGLKILMAAYNGFQVLVNLVLGYYIVHFMIEVKFHLCQPVNFLDNRLGRKEMLIAYSYYLVKLLDFLDTIFFVLRKKYNQISFLHVYHHLVVAGGSYAVIKFLPGGQAFYIGLFNTFVHVFMYLYYFLTCVNPDIKKLDWIKKSITQIQLFQFAMLAMIFAYPLMFMKDCNYPSYVLLFGIVQNFFMFVLFSDFYRRAYLKKKV